MSDYGVLSTGSFSLHGLLGISLSVRLTLTNFDRKTIRVNTASDEV